MNRTAIKALPAAMFAALGLMGIREAAALEPANWQVGPLFLTPTLDLETYYTDNLWLTNSREKNTWVGVLTPRLQAWLQNGNNTYSLTYELKDSSYASSQDDDFTDHQVNLDLHQEMGARHRLDVFAEYYDGHEDRGTGFIEGDLSLLTDRPVKYEATTGGGDYTYGSRESRGRLQLSARAVDYQYGNYRDFTRFYDRSEETVAGSLFWKIAPRTDAVLEVRGIDNDYDNRDPLDLAGSLSSEEMNYLAGVVWEATAKTSGSIKLGMYDRDYSSAARASDDGFLWEVGVVYQPRTYSSLDLQTRRHYRETTGLGDGINTREFALAWKHHWKRRYTSSLSASYSNDDYRGYSREDDNYGVEARFDYAFRRWVDLGAGYRFQDRDSDLDWFDYSSNIFFLEASLSL